MIDSDVALVESMSLHETLELHSKKVLMLIGNDTESFLALADERIEVLDHERERDDRSTSPCERRRPVPVVVAELVRDLSSGHVRHRV